MCGISGIVSKSGLNSGQKDAQDRMRLALEHRGYDASKIEFFSHCTLAHNRLSIVDISGGTQPMIMNANAIVFNGEIYGFNEIKNRLSTEFTFTTKSDTELILVLYKKWGIHLVKHLPGMFSFAIWNNETRELFCARDRFGEKPFYYGIGKNGEFIFASEIKAIIASGLIDAQIDESSIAHYLKRAYVSPQKTIYKNIFVLPAAHQLLLKNGELKIERYWNLPERQSSMSYNDAKQEFLSLLDRSVKKQLVADIEVGAFLSGGVDSSSVVALAAKYNKSLTTFSFGFGDDINELPFANTVAKQFNTNHIEIVQDESHIADLIIEMQRVYDEPFADSSCIPTYLISKEAKKTLSVVLTGDGGDELLAGYKWYNDLLNIENPSPFNVKNIIKKAIIKPSFKNSFIEAHKNQNSYFTNVELNKLLLFKTTFVEPSYSFMPQNNLSDAMKMDIENYMVGDILVKIDRASMANSLELRSPYLDVDLAEFLIGLPFEYKLDANQGKKIQKDAFKGLLPNIILDRQKQGFGAPVINWLKLKNVKQLIENYLFDKNGIVFQYLDYNIVQQIIKNNGYQTWSVLNLALWLDARKYK